MYRSPTNYQTVIQEDQKKVAGKMSSFQHNATEAIQIYIQ